MPRGNRDLPPGVDPELVQRFRQRLADNPASQRGSANAGHQGSAADPGVCALRWCDETINHGGPHRRYLLSGHGMDVGTGRAATIAVNLQGESARVRGLVVTVGECEVALPWALASQLAGIIHAAIRRYGQ